MRPHIYRVSVYDWYWNLDPVESYYIVAKDLATANRKSNCLSSKVGWTQITGKYEYKEE